MNRVQSTPIFGCLADKSEVLRKSSPVHKGNSETNRITGLNNISKGIRVDLSLSVFIYRIHISPKLGPCKTHSMGLLASRQKMVPQGRLHMRPFQWHLLENWKSPQLLDKLHPWSDTIVVVVRPQNQLKGADSNIILNQDSTKGLWPVVEKKLH